MTLTFLPRYAWCRRSKNGNAIWQTGQETLKNASTSGPASSAEARLKLPPCNVGSDISGALIPAVSAGILHQMLQQALVTQDLARKPGERDLPEPGEWDPPAFRAAGWLLSRGDADKIVGVGYRMPKGDGVLSHPGIVGRQLPHRRHHGCCSRPLDQQHPVVVCYQREANPFGLRFRFR